MDINVRTIAILCCIALLGAVLVLYATPWGSGVSPDSAVYIGAARGLLAGEGLVVPFGADAGSPLTHHAPLYPLVLAMLGLFGAEPLHAARWLNAVLFAGNIFLIGVFVNSLVQGKSWVMPVLGALLAMMSAPLLTVHVMAWSEPLFLFLGLGGLWLVTRYTATCRRRLLVLSAFSLGLALFTRYAGIAVVCAGLLGVILLGSGRSLRRRLVDGLFLATVGLLPISFWMLYNYLNVGTTTNRALAWHPIGTAHAWSALYTVSSWFLIPTAAGNYVRIGLMLLLVVICIGAIAVRMRAWQANPADSRFSLRYVFPALASQLLLFAALYLLFLTASISLLDANIPLDDRILSPLFAVCIVLLLYFVYEIWPFVARVPFAGLLPLFIVVYLFVHVGAANRHVRIARAQGIGLTGATWRESGTIDCVRRMPEELTIFTNSPQALYIYTGHSTQLLPRKTESTTGRPNSDYENELQQLSILLEQQAGIVVYFSRLEWATFPSIEELRTQFPLIAVFEQDDGLIFMAANEKSMRTAGAACPMP